MSFNKIDPKDKQPRFGSSIANQRDRSTKLDSSEVHNPYIKEARSPRSMVQKDSNERIKEEEQLEIQKEISSKFEQKVEPEAN